MSELLPAVPITTDRQRGIALDAVSMLWVLGFLTDRERQALTDKIEATEERS